MLQTSAIPIISPAHTPPKLAFGQASEFYNNTDNATYVILAVCLAIPLLLMLPIIFGSPLPPPRMGHISEPTVYPPKRVLVFTGIICVGAVANVTVILPSATEVAKASGQSTAFSGVLIGQYSIGAFAAFAGLYFFASLPIEYLWQSYMAHACFMLVGNGAWALGVKQDGPWLLCVARILVGMEGGCMYNTALAMVHFAKGPAYTACLVLYQTFNAVGALLGPVLASGLIATGRWLGVSYEHVLVNAVMSLWGAVLLVAILVVSPPDYGISHSAEHHFASIPEQVEGSHTEDSGTTSISSSSCLSLMLLFVYSALLRVGQRLLCESGIIFILEEFYHWNTTQAGLSMGAVGVCCAIFQVVFSCTVAGRYEDSKVMWLLELAQFVGILIMMPMPWKNDRATVVMLLLGGAIAYSTNAIWGGFNAAFCMKRCSEGSLASRTRMLICNQAAIFAGIALGGVSSRYLLTALLHPMALVLAMLVPCFLQVVIMMTISQGHPKPSTLPGNNKPDC